MAVIDFHTHILPGIDDGSRSERMSLQMLHTAARGKVDVVVATPHFYASDTSVSRFLAERERSFVRLERCRRGSRPEIIPGAEVAFFSGIGRAEQIGRLCIEQTNLLLLEMPFSAWSEHDLWEIELLLDRGIQPVIAHLERFYRFQHDRNMIPMLLDMPVYVQINAECLLNWKTRHRGLKLFRSGQAHLLGSDCHNISSRPENLRQGRSVIAEKLGHSALREIDRLGTKLLRL